MLSASLLVAVLLPAAHVLADLSCSQATDLVNDLVVRPQQSTVTQYCSSLLQLSTVTTTTTTTVTHGVATATTTMTTPSPSATTTTTSTSVILFSTTVTSTTTSIVSVTSTTAITCAAGGGVPTAQPSTTVVNNNKKRATQAPLYPDPSIARSKYCYCMIPTPTSTVAASTTLSQSTSTSTVTSFSGPQGTTTIRSVIASSSTTTINTIKTATATAYYVQPSLSSFSGLTYSAHPMNYSFYNADPGWDVTTFYSSRAGAPLATGEVQKILDVHSTSSAPYACANLPGQSQSTACEYVAVKMQGFIYAATAGTYTVATGIDVDNYLGMWSYSNAYAYTNGNADWQAKRAGDDRSQDRGGSKTFSLQKGEFLPVTFIWMNGGGPGLFSFSITGPDGVAKSDTSGYFVPACASGSLFAN